MKRFLPVLLIAALVLALALILPAVTRPASPVSRIHTAEPTRDPSAPMTDQELWDLAGQLGIR